MLNGDKVGRFKALPERERPTYHEIRGLGSRLYLERGRAKRDIQELMTHSSQQTTEIYLERGPQALKALCYWRSTMRRIRSISRTCSNTRCFNGSRSP